MKAVMVMFDSLNRHMLPGYGCDWTKLPNFARLAARTVQFERAYVCSMPCMPARREIHTGRPNFLHRSWGPLEPFDDSMPQMLRENGVYTHLATDHYHYFEDGGATYHTRYSSYEFFRGQEGDPWIGQLADPNLPDTVWQRTDGPWRQDKVNRKFMPREELQPQPQTFKAGLEFMQRNATQDNWFLQIETFDPHEPFFSQRKYKDLYAEHYDNYKGDPFDWPPYRPVSETADVVEHARFEYAALMSMCDSYLGDVLDSMDKLNLWDDTMLIVCTDHGFMLGENECWAKCWQPFYEEVCHVPLYIWDPRCGKKGESRQSMVQTIDFAPTLLEFFGVELTADMLGRPLRDVVANDKPIHQTAMFGIHGGQVNVTDGRYSYFRGPTSIDNTPLNNYTLMPTHMRGHFSVETLVDNIELAEPFTFTKGCQTMKVRCNGTFVGVRTGLQETFLYDLKTDPQQKCPIHDSEVEKMMIGHLIELMRACDAPVEQYERLGLADVA